MQVREGGKQFSKEVKACHQVGEISGQWLQSWKSEQQA
jgi:hypothetical protein